ncbi:MAG: NUDIX hydrolase [Chlamydiales bacterium]|nr:NUDIX hydrolase [Chlamydiales bacterium]
MARAQDIKVYEQKPNDFSHKVEVAATYVNVRGKLLLLELSHNKSEAGAWGVPAGKLEENETSLNGAKRELLEETSIDVSKNQFQSFGQLYIRKPDIDYIYHVFSVRLAKLPTIILSSEHLSYKWVSLKEAENLPLMDGAQQALDFYYRHL